MQIAPVTVDRLSAVAVLRQALGVSGFSAVAESQASIVELSTTGVFVSTAVAALEGRGRLTATIGTVEFANIAAAAGLFVDAFNGLQEVSAKLSNRLGVSSIEIFMDALQARPVAGDSQTLLVALAGVGISLLDSGRFTIDSDALHTGFVAEPVLTASLLQQAVGSFGPLLANFFNRSDSLLANNTAVVVLANQVTPPTTVELTENSAAAQTAVADATLNEAAAATVVAVTVPAPGTTEEAAAPVAVPAVPLPELATVPAAIATPVTPVAGATGPAATATAIAATQPTTALFDAGDAQRLVTDPAAAAIVAAYRLAGLDFAVRMTNQPAPPVPDDVPLVVRTRTISERA